MYEVNDKICLWQIKIVLGSTEVRVVKEVMVTITETKTGVPGEFSGHPAPFESLRGLGNDGKVYEKHWDFWPESQACDFTTQWTIREDGEGEGLEIFWAPAEATHVYNELASRRKGTPEFTLIDKDGASILPKGDFDYCLEHDSYWSRRIECFWCHVENISKRKAAMADRAR